MHPMFVKLFIDTDADDLLAYEEEEEKRRQSRRVRHNQSRTMTMTTVRGRSRPPRSP